MYLSVLKTHKTPELAERGSARLDDPRNKASYAEDLLRTAVPRLALGTELPLGTPTQEIYIHFFYRINNCQRGHLIMGQIRNYLIILLILTDNFTAYCFLIKAPFLTQ